ncbi:hypothetical protein [Microvirga flavescens]|uniref:hypothetical protein n=1 Tax=Microvirga flavescens TaxID=2249811 RepID=UPI000DDA0A3B|nr:hypothetical protein [Microvirga flavescens]
MQDILFVGTKKNALHGNGKVGYFFQYAEPILNRCGLNVFKYESFDALEARISQHKRAVVALIYNEEESFEEVLNTEDLCSNHLERFLLVHPYKTGQIVSSKAASNEAFSKRGINVPPMAAGTTALGKVFSNVIQGSGQAVSTRHAGETLDERRYNTAFINTVHSFRGKDYFVSLRAMCVGGVCHSVYVRCRPVDEGNPSVHAINTPLEPDLLNYLYTRLVIGFRDYINEICRSVGDVLGLGFYSHDLLPCADSGEIYICETGFKFDEISLKHHLMPIKDQVVMADLFEGREIIKAAHLFVQQAADLGFLSYKKPPTALGV